MRTIELMREGVPSGDGRTVAAGAVTWPDVIPILGFDDAGTSEIHGQVTNIRREGRYIFGDVEIEIPAGACLTVGGKVGDDVVEVGDGTILALKFEMQYATVSDGDDYPWKD